MIPTRTPRTVRKTRRQLLVRCVGAGRALTPLVLRCALVLTAFAPARADDPAEGSDSSQDTVVTPADESAVFAAQSTESSLEGDVLPVSGGIFRRLSPDECCPSFDECCPCIDENLSCCTTGCDGCDSICCRSDANFYFGVEFGVLQPEVGRLQVPGTANPQSLKPDHSYEFAPRFFGGFQTCEGWGGQINYWTLETGANGTNLPNIFHDLDLQTVDVDFTKTCELGEWSVQLGAGGRWGNIESNYFSAVNPNQRLTTDFEGSGPTALVNVRRPLGCGNWAVVGEGRASFLFGDTAVDAPLVPNLTIDDDVVRIWEGRAGIEWTGPSASGDALFFVRALFEGQFWNVPSVGPAGSPDLNFLGPTLSVGFVF
jgi:hypothetical protein